MNKAEKIPKFKNEDEENQFWQKNDSNKYIDWSKAKDASFPNLKISTKKISLRLPEELIEGLKNIAKRNDVPYHSLIEILLKESVERDIRSQI